MVSVIPAAFGLAFVSSVNILITSRIVEHFRGRHKQLKLADADTECRSLRHRQHGGGRFRRSDECRHPGTQFGKCTLRRRDPHVQSVTRGIHSGLHRPRRELYFENTDPRASRSDRLYRYLLTRMEHLAHGSPACEKWTRSPSSLPPPRF